MKLQIMLWRQDVRAMVSSRVMVVGLRAGIGIGSSVLLVGMLHAQDPAHDQAHTRALAPIPASFALPEASLEFDHYEIPAQCASGMTRIDDSTRVHIARLDTLAPGPWDTLSTVAVQFAKRCLARFPVTATTPLDYGPMLSLAMAVKDTAAIPGIVARQTAAFATAPAPARAAILRDALDSLIRSHPKFIALARTMVTQIDALGPQAQWEQFQIRYDMAIAFPTDVDSQIAYGLERLRHAQQLDLQALPPGLRAVVPYMIRTIQRDLLWMQFVKSGKQELFTQYAALAGTSMPGMYIYDMIGKLAPAITGDVWFNMPANTPTGPTGATSWVPTPGTVSLVVFLDQNPADANTSRNYAFLRRLHARFPTVQFLIVAATEGFFRRLPEPLTPAQEAVQIHQYSSNFLRLPGMLSVSTSTFRPLADGRFLQLPTQNMLRYHMGFQGRGLLIDQQGRIAQHLFLANMRENEEGLLFEHELPRLLQPVQADAGTH